MLIIVQLVAAILLGPNILASRYSEPAHPQSSQEQTTNIIEIKDAHEKTDGLVLFTEDELLVFYMYDLRETDRYTYYVWGITDGNPETVRSLGGVALDANTQRRWKLEVTDPKMLTRLDRIFVTAEPIGKKPERPEGKRILIAYLHAPR